MKNILALCAAAAVLMGIGATDAAAQDDRGGTQAMEELLVPVTPRTVALGAALTGGLDGMNGVEAVQSNPASLLSSSGTNAMFSRTEYVADIGINFLGVSQSFGANSIALTLTAWDYGDINRTTEENPDINPDALNTYSASTYAFGATYGRQFTDRIGAGVTVKALGRTIDNVNSTGVALDAGISYAVPESGLRFGVSLQNFGGAMSFAGDGLSRVIVNPGPAGQGTILGEVDDLPAELPSALSFGGSYTRQFAGDLSATALANYKSVSYDMDRYSAALELGYKSLVYARGGVNMTADQAQEHWQGWNVGGGLNLDLGGTKLTVDYAFRPSDVFSNVNLFSVGIGL